jgi:aspartyl-tRNA(Asn)/glutamyl-tRNA(Gln) amidotransferase subunit C
MSVSPADVERIASLAELAVSPEELPELTAQLDRIIGFVAQLSASGDTAPEGDVQTGLLETPLREDVVIPAALVRGPAEIAPEFVEGFFVVPKLGAMEE